MLYILSLLGVFTAATALRIPEERIVNGKSIDISEAPYQVSLLENSECNCGGAILSQRIIITAAHCVRGRLPEELSIEAGSKYCDKGGQRIDVVDFLDHKDYIMPTVGPNDVAILLLSQPLEYNSKVQPIAMAKESPKVGDRALVSGWGQYDFILPKYPEDLQGLELEIINVSNDVILTNPGQKNVFRGDSGGPLVDNGYLVGVVSGGNPLRGTEYPNLVHLHDWIENAVAYLVEINE